MKILVTGAAGFIGFYTVKKLAERGDEVVGLDNINDYYDVNLKYSRLAETGIFKEGIKYGKLTQSSKFPNYRFIKLNLQDREGLPKLFEQEKFDKVVSLAAQAGVRYSITNPFAYIDSNIVGFVNILECCRYNNVRHLVYASSSSVYGMNTKTPFSEDDIVINPVSLYAASKKSDELMAHAYSKLYDIPTTGLRYFTVYGPWGRPDMSPMLFATAITKGETINIFNNGDMLRDFTYIDDIVNGTINVIDQIPTKEECPNEVLAKVYNIGCGHTTKLMDFISEIEKNMGKEAKKAYLPMQPGDVYQTYADTTKLEKERGYKPKVLLHDGIKEFIKWYNNNLSEDNTIGNM